MDHKVSKDMISSGMIPSGEKTQADLGRTQYGSAPSPSSLVEAYRSIYEHHQKDADGKVIEHGEKEELNEGRMRNKKDILPTPTPSKPDKPSTPSKPDKPSTPSKPVPQMNDVDLFDLVKGKLIDEGCEEKEALKIMANMTKEEFDEVSEGLAGMALKLGGAALGAYGAYKAGQKMGTKGPQPSPQPKPSKPVKQPGLLQKLKDRRDATNKAIEQM